MISKGHEDNDDKWRLVPIFDTAKPGTTARLYRDRRVGHVAKDGSVYNPPHALCDKCAERERRRHVDDHIAGYKKWRMELVNGDFGWRCIYANDPTVECDSASR